MKAARVSGVISSSIIKRSSVGKVKKFRLGRITTAMWMFLVRIRASCG